MPIAVFLPFFFYKYSIFKEKMLSDVSHRNRPALFPSSESVKKTDDHKGKGSER
jgi:hypothetical protein